MAEWDVSKNGKLTPDSVAYSSNKRVWWICEKRHEWCATINNRTTGRTNCPFCSGKKPSNENCLQSRHPDLSKEWNFSRNGKLTPSGVTSGSGRVVWWTCSEGHEWKSSVGNRANLGRGCPYCLVSKGESKLVRVFSNRSLIYDREVKFRDCKNRSLLRFDFVVYGQPMADKPLKVLFAVEFQGPHHYKPVLYSRKSCFKKAEDDFKSIKHRDALKKIFCEKEGISLLEIPYWEYENIEFLVDEFINKNGLIYN